jgi:hypothetical protein
MKLEVWEATPLTDLRAGDRCTHQHRLEQSPEEVEGYGCHGDHVAFVMRRRLIDEIEARGRFHFDDLDHEDDGIAGDAWGRLTEVARAVGVPEERRKEIAGWSEEDESPTGTKGER